MPFALIGLGRDPIFFSFSFSGDERPELELGRFIQNNRLFFQRGSPRSRQLQARRQEFSSPNAEPGFVLELGLGGLFGGKESEADKLSEEEYRLDPGFRGADAVLAGMLPS